MTINSGGSSLGVQNITMTPNPCVELQDLQHQISAIGADNDINSWLKLREIAKQAYQLLD